MFILPMLVLAKDKESGERMKLKKGRVQSVSPYGIVVVKMNDHYYNINFAKADEDKFEFLNDEKVYSDPMSLKPGDLITCRGRRFPTEFVPSKCYWVDYSRDPRYEDMQEDLFEEDEGFFVVDIYGVDPWNDLIYAAHSLNKEKLTIVEGEKSKRYKGERYNTHGDDVYEAYWRILVKGEMSEIEGADGEDYDYIEDVEYIKIISKHDNEPKYGY
jgi:hypothetical protein